MMALFEIPSFLMHAECCLIQVENFGDQERHPVSIFWLEYGGSTTTNKHIK